MTIALLIVAYLFGSIPSAVIVCRALGLPDPRQAGSANPGTTNVLRIGGKKAAIMTLVSDMLKGFIPVFLTHFIHTTPLLTGCILLSAFSGHVFSIFLRFHGGKGVATLLGGLFGLSWIIGLMTMGTWIMVATITRYSSLSAMIAAIVMPVYVFFFLSPFTAFPLIALTVILLWKHRGNIQRLMKGIEPEIGQRNMPTPSNDDQF